MKTEKRFTNPEAEIIEFNNDDIILTSGEGDIGGVSYPWGGGNQSPISTNALKADLIPPFYIVLLN